MKSTSIVPEKNVTPVRSSQELLARLPAELREEADSLIRDVRTVSDGLRAARRKLAMEIAPRIVALKERLCHHGASRGNQYISAKIENSNLAPITWTEFVSQAFGVTHETVDAWIESYEARGRFVSLIDGREVRYLAKDPFTKERIEIVVPADKFPVEKLQAELDEIDLGTKPATRAWAGLQTGQQAGSQRAPVDHLQVWKKACVALRPENYQALIGKQKTTAIDSLTEAIVALPADVREAITFALKRSL